MGASNTPLYDLIELQGLLANTTYTTAPGGGGDIIGTVDNATYTDSHTGNSATNITELNTTADFDNGTISIDGVTYNINLADPDNTNVTITYNGGASTINLTGDSGTSQVVFITADPLGGGSTRWFMAVDDTIGALPDITSIQIRSLDYTPAGQDVKINLDQNNNVTACFAAGTRIETLEGPRAVEALVVGDQVLTRDRGAATVAWIQGETVKLNNEARKQRHAPVRIKRGALGLGVPARDLVVSPQHRMLVVSRIAERLFGAAEVLVPAKMLVGWPGVKRVRGWEVAVYWHIWLGTHEVVLAEGAPSESLLPEEGALAGFSAEARRALLRLAPGAVTPARPILEKGRDVKELLRRHKKNGRALVAPGAVDGVGAVAQADAGAARPARRDLRSVLRLVG